MAIISAMISILCVSFIVTILFLGLALFWYYWKCIRPYRQFPSFRVDVKLLVKALMGRYPKNVPSSSVLFQELVKTSRKFYRNEMCIMWLLRPYLWIYGADIMKLFSNETAAVNKSSAYDVLKEGLGNGLIGSKEELWKPHRKLTNPAFSLIILKDSMHIFNQNAADLINKIQSIGGKPTDDVLNLVKNCAFNVLAASILGVNLNNEVYEPKIKHLMKMVEEMEELAIHKLTRPWLNWSSLAYLFSAGRRNKEIIKCTRLYINEIIDDLIKSCTTSETPIKNSDNDIQRKKLLSEILIEQHLNDPTFTRDYLQDHLITFIVAGYESIAYTLMWCIYVLGHNSGVQREAYREIESVVLKEDVTYNDLCNLKYLDCVVKETLRLYPTVPIYGRKLSKAIHYGKYTIPKGTEIFFFGFMLYRNPDIYPEPDKFNPERFADNPAIRPWMHVPFAEGYRNCIGKKYAMMELKVLLVHVLRRFEVQSLDTVKEEDLDWSIVLKTTKPLRMMFKPRPEL